MHVLAGLRIRELAHLSFTDRQYGVGGLGEKEGRFAARIAPHFPCMGGVIARDAEDAAHRKQPAAYDRHRWARRRFEYIGILGIESHR
jgi:hypothetical protein